MFHFYAFVYEHFEKFQIAFSFYFSSWIAPKTAVKYILKEVGQKKEQIAKSYTSWPASQCKTIP